MTEDEYTAVQNTAYITAALASLRQIMPVDVGGISIKQIQIGELISRAVQLQTELHSIEFISDGGD